MGFDQVLAFATWHWFLELPAMAAAIPVALILRRIGLSPWWAVLCVLPVISWVGVWALAFVRWPNVRRAEGSGAAPDPI